MNKTRNKHTIIIADDHPIFRKGLREIIESTSQYTVIAEAESGKMALKYYQQCVPDVIILDISMGDMNGLEVAEDILKNNKQAICVIMTMYNELAFCHRALSLGVKGYVLKDDAADMMLDCLDQVMNQQRFISPTLGNHINSTHISNHDNITITEINVHHKSTTEDSPEAILTKKELEILVSIAQLKTNKEIAKELNIAHRTVQNHRQNISNKLQLSGRQALLQFAIKWAEQLRL